MLVPAIKYKNIIIEFLHLLLGFITSILRYFSVGQNALHIACREGHLQVVQTLLAESQINAEAMTLKCRNPLHELAKHSKESAAAICEVFLEYMPKYPLEIQDGEGNTGT